MSVCSSTCLGVASLQKLALPSSLALSSGGAKRYQLHSIANGRLHASCKLNLQCSRLVNKRHFRIPFEVVGSSSQGFQAEQKCTVIRKVGFAPPPPLYIGIGISNKSLTYPKSPEISHILRTIFDISWNLSEVSGKTLSLLYNTFIICNSYLKCIQPVLQFIATMNRLIRSYQIIGIQIDKGVNGECIEYEQMDSLEMVQSHCIQPSYLCSGLLAALRIGWQTSSTGPPMLIALRWKYSFLLSLIDLIFIYFYQFIYMLCFAPNDFAEFCVF